MPHTIKIDMLDNEAFLEPVDRLNGSFNAYLAATRAAGFRFLEDKDSGRKGQAGSIGDLPLACEKLTAAGFTLVITPMARLAAQEAAAKVVSPEARLEEIVAELASRGLKPYPYQIDGIRYLLGRKASLLADDMGLGKTNQAILSVPKNSATIVVCPASVKGSWKREVALWRPDLTAVVLSGEHSFRMPKAGEVVILSWDTQPPTDAEREAATVALGVERLERERAKSSIDALAAGYYTALAHDVAGRAFRAIVIAAKCALLARQDRKIADLEQTTKPLEPAPSGLNVILDECFPAGTMVETDRGPMPIEEIVDGCSPVSVLSCNPSTNALEWKSVKRWIKLARKQELVRVSHEGGSFVCTANHEISTVEGGYVRADCLTRNHTLRTVRDVVRDPQAREDDSAILQSVVRGDSGQRATGSEGEAVSSISSPGRGEEVPSVRGSFRRAVSLAWEAIEKVTALLWWFVRGDVACATAGLRRGFHGGGEAVSRILAGQEAAGHRRAHARKQSDEGLAGTQQGVVDEDGESVARMARRQWQEDAVSTVSSSCRARGGMGGRASSEHSRTHDAAQTAERVQARSGFGVDEGGRRSGWAQSQCDQATGRGHEEGKRVVLARVEGVEVLECNGVVGSRGGSAGDPFVYCLEVEDNHNFFADGVLVSNCHYAKSFKAQRTKRARSLVALGRAAGGAAIGLTGTPMLNQLGELWTVLQTFGLGSQGYGSFDRYVEIFGGHRGTYGIEWPPFKDNDSESMADDDFEQRAYGRD